MAVTVVARVLCLQALVAVVKMSSDTNQKPVTEEIDPQPDCDPVWVNQGGTAVYLCVKKAVHYSQDGQEQTKLLDLTQDFEDLNTQDLQEVNTQYFQQVNKVPRDFQEVNKVPQDFHEVNEVPQDFQEVNKVPQDFQEVNKVPQDFQEINKVPQDFQKVNKVPHDFQEVNKVPQDFQEKNKDLGDSQEVTELLVDTAIHTEPETSQVMDIGSDTLFLAQPFTAYNLGLLVTALCVMVAVLQYTMARHKTSTWHKLGYPGPICSSILGNYWEVMMEGGLRRCVKRWHLLYGNIFGIHLGLSPVLVICDTSLIAGILENESGCFTNRANITAALNCPSLKFSLFNINDSRWLTMRYNLSFLFNEENLKYMLQHLNPCAGRLANYLHQELQNTEIVSLKEFVTSYEYDIIASMLLGLNIDHHLDNDDPFFQCLTSAFKSPTMEYEAVSVPSDMKMLFGYLQCAVHNRSERRTFREPVDYLDLLLRRGASLSPVSIPPYELNWPEVYSNLLLWILHSHQTMISTLQFVIYMLAHNPRYQIMAFDEMECTLGKRDLTYHDLQELAVLDSVILETLRLFSPVQEIWRKSSFETSIFGMAFPKDVDILIPVDLVHTNESNFSNPDHFQPERWGLGTFGQLPHPAFLAFGYGPRACIASDLVLLQLKVALVHCMRLIKFEPTHQDPLPPQQHLEVKLGLGVSTEGILRPATSVKVELTLREPGFSPPPPTEHKPRSVPFPLDAASPQPVLAPPQPSPVPVVPTVSQTPQETPPSFKPPVSVQLIKADEGVQPVKKSRSLTSTRPASFDPDASRERKRKEEEQLTTRLPKDTIVVQVDTDEVGRQMLPSLATALDSASSTLMGKQTTPVRTHPSNTTPRPRTKDTKPHRSHKERPMSYLPGSVDSNLQVAPYEGGVEEHPLFRDFRDVQNMAQHLIEELDRVRPCETRPEPNLLRLRETERARSGNDHLFLDIDISRQTSEIESESALDQSLSRFFSAIDLSDESFVALAEAEIARSCDLQASEYQTMESLLLQNLNALYNRLKCLGSHLVITLHISDDEPTFFEPEESLDGFESRCLAYPLHGPQTAGVDTRLPFTSRSASQIPGKATTETKKVQATPNKAQAKNNRIMQVGVPRSGQIVDEITEAAQDVVMTDVSQPALSIDVTQPSDKSIADATYPPVRLSEADDSKPSEGISMAYATQPSPKWHLEKPPATDWAELNRRLKEPRIKKGSSAEDLTVPREKGTSGYFKRPWGRAPGKSDHWPPLRKPEIPERFRSNIRFAATHGIVPRDREASKTTASTSTRSSLATFASDSAWPALRERSQSMAQSLYSFVQRSSILPPSLETNASDGAGPSFRERSKSMVQSVYSAVKRSSILSPALEKMSSALPLGGFKESKTIGLSDRADQATAEESSQDKFQESELKKTPISDYEELIEEESPPDDEDTLPSEITTDDLEEIIKGEISLDDLDETIKEENILADNEDTTEEEISLDDLDETIKEENILVDNEDTTEEEISLDDLEETAKEDSPLADMKDTIEKESSPDGLQNHTGKRPPDGPEMDKKEKEHKDTANSKNKSKDGAEKEQSPKDDAKKEKPPKDGAKKEKSPKDSAKKEKPPKDSAKKEKPPKDGAQKEKSPKDDAKKEKKPKDDAKKEKSPKDGAKKEKSPKDGAQKEKSPKDDAKKEKSPKDGAKKEKSPKDDAKKEKSPKDDAKKEKSPKDDAKKEKSPKDGAKKEKSPKDGAKKEKSPKDDAKKEKSPKDDAKKEKSPKDDAKKEKSPKDGAKKEKSPKDDAKKEKSPKDGAKKEKSPKDDAKKEKSPKDGAKKEKSPKDDAKKEKSPKDGAKKEKSPKDDAKKKKKV